MGFTLQSDAEHRVVLVTLGNVVTEDSALAAYTAVERFIAVSGPHSGITDLSSVEKLLVSRNIVWRLAERPAMIPDGMARLVVAPRQAIYGVSRMFQTIRDNRKGYLEIVRSLEEAFNLLRLESARFRLIDSDQPRRLAAR